MVGFGACQLSVGPGAEKDIIEYLDQETTSAAIGFYGPADSVVLEVSIVGKGAVWSLWQAPVGELPQKLLGFWGKTVPSITEVCMLFEKQLVVCY